MHRNIELLAMILVDSKVVWVTGGHVVSKDTNEPVLHLPCNMGV